MKIISKNSKGFERTYEDVRRAVVVTDIGERLNFTALEYDLVYINEDDIQLFALASKN